MLRRAIGSIPSLAFATVLTCVASTVFGGMAFAATDVDRNAFWVESTVCSVVVKTSIDAVKPLSGGNPIETLAGVKANCTGNMMVQAEVQGGVRLLLQQGFRVTSLSHQITPLRTDGGGNVMLLISAMFTLERPQAKTAPIAK